VIDAGANLGYHTIFLSKLVGNNGAVLAFEPDPVHYEKLKSNLALNNVKNVAAYPHALLNGYGNLDFFSYPGGGYSSFAPFKGSTKVKVPTFALDDILIPDAHIRMMKIDCEGAEELILKGARKSLLRTDAVVLEFNYSIMPIFGSTDRAIRDFMDELGFDLFVLRRDGSEPVKVPLDIKIKMEGREPHVFNGLFARRGAS
jgi:FkbM family methyltransferase